MPQAVLYARFSPRPSPEEYDSVEKQIERCRAYSAGHGYTVVSEHHDKDLSGGRADNGPVFKRRLLPPVSERPSWSSIRSPGSPAAPRMPSTSPNGSALPAPTSR
jgi:hypothetical protein